MKFREYLNESRYAFKVGQMSDNNDFPNNQKNIKGKLIQALGDESVKTYEILVTDQPKKATSNVWRVKGVLKKKGYAGKHPANIGDNIEAYWHYGNWMINEP